MLLQKLSLRGRFLVAPFIGVILTLILYFSSNAIIHSQSNLFQTIQETNLPQISEISQLILLQSNNHNELIKLLLSSTETPDEEKIYVQGRTILNQLHIIEEKLLAKLHSHENDVEYNSLVNSIRLNISLYRESSINAIELSSVDARLATKELTIASNASEKLNTSFLEFSKHYEQKLLNTSRLVEESLLNQNKINILAVALIAFMIFSALYFSKQMSLETQRQQQDLITSRLEAEKANKAKSEFLSRMSHELRTPMNAILGFGQLLNMTSGTLDESQKKHTQEIISAGEHLLYLINELLDLATIESNKIVVSLEDISITSALDECINMIKPQISASKIELINHFDLKNHVVKADPIRLKQVLLNVLSNAVKYNDIGGTITIDIDDTDKQHTRICISNTGKGLSEDEISRLFIPFDRLNRTSIEGTGIGLVITKHLIERMGGIMDVSSTPNVKTSFCISLLHKKSSSPSSI